MAFGEHVLSELLQVRCMWLEDEDVCLKIIFIVVVLFFQKLHPLLHLPRRCFQKVWSIVQHTIHFRVHRSSDMFVRPVFQ